MATTKKTKPKAAGKPAAKAKAGKPAKHEIERHPLSERFGPTMSDDELKGLTADIKLHGMHEPIIKYEGKVLAGWNRYRACMLAGYEPEFRDLPEGKDPAAVAFGTNFMRRRLSSVQKAFFGAQFCHDTGAKQTDVAEMLACNLNRLNQCCQLLKQDSPSAKTAIENLRGNPDMGGAQFDELMLELGIARESKPRPSPARASAGGGLDVDDDDPLGGDLDVDDITGGAIDTLLDDDDDHHGDEPSPAAAKRAKKGEAEGDEPLPPVGTKRNTSMKNPHETQVSRVSKAFGQLSEVERRQFVRFTWGKLKPALDAAIGGADVEYVPPEVIKVDPSRIARKKPADKLDDGQPTKPSKAKAKSKSTPAAKKPPAKAKRNGKRAAHDEDI